jgi:hypothetical protein
VSKDPTLRGLYGRLTGLKNALPSNTTCRGMIGEDYNQIVEELSVTLSENLYSFRLDYYDAFFDERKWLYTDLLRSKVEQLLGYLNAVHFVSEAIVEIGSLYNVISDEELKKRCADLLTAHDSFDRAINQATLVLEARIRNRAELPQDLIGKGLVDKALSSDISKAILVASDDPQEHEGICHICRGIVGAFRNPTHHRLLDHYTREDALRLCGFIDQLLSVIDKARVRKA